MLKDFLIAAGVSPADIADAVRESRGLVRSVEKWAGFATKAAAHVAEKAKPDSLLQKGAQIATVASYTVNEKAGELLGRGRKKG